MSESYLCISKPGFFRGQGKALGLPAYATFSSSCMVYYCHPLVVHVVGHTSCMTVYEERTTHLLQEIDCGHSISFNFFQEPTPQLSLVLSADACAHVRRSAAHVARHMRPTSGVLWAQAQQDADAHAHIYRPLFLSWGVCTSNGMHKAWNPRSVEIAIVSIAQVRTDSMEPPS